MDTQGKKIVVGVAGGIAAYKACHVIRQFKEQGANVRVVPTVNALKFVGAATFEALSGNPVSTEVFDAVDEVQHVHVGQTADLIVIAPATADLMARMVAGRADDLLTSTLLVATCPVVIAPAMHTEMWFHPATQHNVETLRSRGIIVLEPAHGRLTGKDTGPGRLPEPNQIVDMALLALEGASFEQDLKGKKVVITAGGTQENIDPVRYIGNRSSGQQGYALAEVAAHRGAQVTIISGATSELETPSGALVEKIVSARDMAAAVEKQSVDADIIIMAAAVADFRPINEADAKLKKGKSDDALAQVNLVENPDILKATVERRKAGEISSDAVIVGFAAETGDDSHTPLELAQQKIVRKGCDLLMCNQVGIGKVFGQTTNSGWLVFPDGKTEDVELGSKFKVAAQILDATQGILGKR